MWDFRKKRRETEQARKVERVLEAHETVLALYAQLDEPQSKADELAAVRASLERSQGPNPR